MRDNVTVAQTSTLETTAYLLGIMYIILMFTMQVDMIGFPFSVILLSPIKQA